MSFISCPYCIFIRISRDILQMTSFLKNSSQRAAASPASSTAAEAGEQGHSESRSGSESVHSEVTQVIYALIWWPRKVT